MQNSAQLLIGCHRQNNAGWDDSERERERERDDRRDGVHQKADSQNEVVQHRERTIVVDRSQFTLRVGERKGQIAAD